MKRSLGKLFRLRGIAGRGISAITCQSTTTTNGSNMKLNRNYSIRELARYGENVEKYEEENRLRGHVLPKSNYREANKPTDYDITFVEIGDTINLTHLLFTIDRDYLIKNDNQQVKAEHLEGKVITLYFMSLPRNAFDYNIAMWDAAVVMDVYKDLHPQNNFEVVLVPVSEDSSLKYPDGFHRSSSCQQNFDILFSRLPWTAIPFSDVESRERLQRTFGLCCRYIYSRYMLAIVDPMGKVLQYDAWNIFFHYEALGYPFSEERIKNLWEEDAAIIKQPSLKKLLASPERDYVISNKGEQVPIDSFEDKVVGLLFCAKSCNLEAFEELKLAYKEFAEERKIFEVVLIYNKDFEDTSDSSGDKLFWEEFKTMPWLALPFRDPNCTRLNRIFETSSLEHFINGGLVILGPNAEFIELFASHILSLYKIPGFPFTRRRIAQLETEKVKELKPEMICDPNTIIRMKDRSLVPFYQLAGKRVMFVLEFEGCDESLNANFLMMLKRLYRKAKRNGAEFEVVRVLIDSEESSTGKIYSRGMPWLVSRASPWVHANLGSYIWHEKPLNQLSHFPVFAFDQDGKLVRRTKYPTLKDTCFPFSGCDLEEETLAQLNTEFEWNYFDYNRGSIYSHPDNEKIIEWDSNFRFGRH